MDAQRCALWIWYRGDLFRGYQAQVEGPTVQQSFQLALARAGLGGSFAASGRTDKGVHARMQVLSGRVPRDLPLTDFAGRLAAALPEGMGLCAARERHPAFHAQWSCSEKEYRYRLALGEVGEAWRPFAWTPQAEPRLATRAVDAGRLAQVLARCTGQRDFIAFHEKSSPRKARRLSSADLVDLGGGLVEARLRGSGFGRYQVRYLVGSSVAVAADLIPDEAFQAALDRGEAIAGVRAPAAGLILWEVFYPGELDPFAKDRSEPGRLPSLPPFSAKR
jgi:tRNA pseudouridine38-40 synthase